LTDAIFPLFEQREHCRLDLVAVGTGAALALGRSGDADVILVHAENAENAFMEAGHGVLREAVMFNYFVILGPASDPAEIRGGNAREALRKIAQGGHRFLSRGDDSGTHKRELELWKTCGGFRPWPEYVETGRGMGATLTMANEMSGYVLCDEGTAIKMEKRVDLVALVRGGEDLRNNYGALVVDPKKHEGNDALARAFVSFLISPEIQRLIRDYEVDGRRLFEPLRLED
jgi:tungstate transport system substrate-binding protein